jgi:hypothetical protein
MKYNDGLKYRVFKYIKRYWSVTLFTFLKISL